MWNDWYRQRHDDQKKVTKAEIGELSLLPEHTGSFWPKQAQLDVLAINWRTKDILLGECKWSQKPVDREAIQTLIEKTEKVLPGQVAWQVHYAFFARSGLTLAAQALAHEHQAHLVTLAQMESEMQHWPKTQESK